MCQNLVWQKWTNLDMVQNNADFGKMDSYGQLLRLKMWDLWIDEDRLSRKRERESDGESAARETKLVRVCMSTGL